MLASLPSTMPVYSAVGNHESYPVDQFPNPPANSKLMDTVGTPPPRRERETDCNTDRQWW